jgi:geranylgeranyl diphosphate synthase type II
MRYAVLGGGKRIRPLLTCACALSLGSDVAPALAPACAVEFMHAYSLIHDDLPAMDDDDLRRGRPTVHVAFDEATAILAGDACRRLRSKPWSAATLSAETRVLMIEALAHAAGQRGMVGGQAFDIGATGHAISLDALEAMHRAKTGALLGAAVDLGALSVGADKPTRKALAQFSAAVGLAFQVVDDLLDATSTTAAIGKRAGADSAAGKTTFPSLLGVDASRRYASDLLEEGLDALRRG